MHFTVTTTCRNTHALVYVKSNLRRLHNIWHQKQNAKQNPWNVYKGKRTRMTSCFWLFLYFVFYFVFVVIMHQKTFEAHNCLSVCVYVDQKTKKWKNELGSAQLHIAYPLYTCVVLTRLLVEMQEIRLFQRKKNRSEIESFFSPITFHIAVYYLCICVCWICRHKWFTTLPNQYGHTL